MAWLRNADRRNQMVRVHIVQELFKKNTKYFYIEQNYGLVRMKATINNFIRQATIFDMYQLHTKKKYAESEMPE